MDNDNKIIINKSEIHKEVMLFLGDELRNIHKTSQGQVYDIEKEYAKTKKQKSPFVVLILIACFLFVFGLSFFIHKIISAQNQEIQVNLQKFDDLNLKTLLNTVSSAQNNYDNAVRTKSSIEANMESKLKTAQEIFDNDIFVLESLKLSANQYDLKFEEIKKQYNDSITEIHKEFDESIAQAEKQIQEYKKQLAEFDTAKIEAAREQEKALNSERQLRQLETEKLTTMYENRIADINESIEQMRERNNEEMRKTVTEISRKYQEEIDRLDPELRDARANTIIDESEVSDTEKFDGFGKLSEQNIESEKVKNAVKSYQEIYDEYDYIDRTIAAVPQKKSIPKYVETSRNLVNSMGDKFFNTTIEFYNETQKLNLQIDKLNSEIANKNKEIKQINENFEVERSEYEETLLYLMGLQKTNAIFLKTEEKIIKKETELTEEEIQNAINARYEAKAAEYEALNQENKNQQNAEIQQDEKLNQNPENKSELLHSKTDNSLQILSKEELTEQIRSEIPKTRTITENVKRIKVYVAPQAAYLITPEGADAEIKTPKPIKGKIFADEDGSFYFEISPDKNGIIPEIDYEELKKGIAIKILSK